MRPLGVVEVYPPINNPLGGKAISHFMQIDSLVFKRALQTFDTDVVHAPSPATHGDGDLGLLEDSSKIEAGKLVALIGVEYFRLVVFCQCPWKIPPQDPLSLDASKSMFSSDAPYTEPLFPEWFYHRVAHQALPWP